MHVSFGGLSSEKIVHPGEQSKNVGGYPRAGDRTKSAAEHDRIMKTGLNECVREKWTKQTRLQ